MTDGPNPVLIQFREKRFRAIPPAIQAVNPIGSGDSLLAGVVDGWLAGMETEAMVRHAIGCAVANASVWDAGAVDPELAVQFAGSRARADRTGSMRMMAWASRRSRPPLPTLLRSSFFPFSLGLQLIDQRFSP